MKRRLPILMLSCFTIISSCFAGLVGGFVGTKIPGAWNVNNLAQQITNQDVKVVNEQSEVIDVASKASESVVSIVISKDVPVYENYYVNPYDEEDPYGFNFQIPQRRQTGTEQKQVGAGSGFVASADGMIITNKHVVDDESASYTVIFNNEKKYDAKVLARDTLLDIAFLKIEAKDLKPLNLGSSENLKVGQTVIAIGNALGQFSNTVSTGIISGLKRDITAGDSKGLSEQLSDVIQTDASINLGNSGGPLLDIQGNVIGVNVAIASNAQNVGFAIPVDVVKDLLQRLSKEGKIERPALGVRYQLVTKTLQEKNKLTVDYGALVVRGTSADDLAVIPGSPADKAGIVENDIILEVNSVKVNAKNPLVNLIQSYKVGDEVTLKILRKGQELSVKVKLEKF